MFLASAPVVKMNFKAFNNFDFSGSFEIVYELRKCCYERKQTTSKIFFMFHSS